MSCYICQKGNCRFYACRYCGENSCSAVCTKTHRDVASACEDIFTKASGVSRDLLSSTTMSTASGGTEVAAAVMNGLAEALGVSIQTLCPVLLRDALVKRCAEEGSALPEDHPLRVILRLSSSSLASSAAAVTGHGSTQSNAAPSTSQEMSPGEANKKEEGVGQERGRSNNDNNKNNTSSSGSRPAAIAGQKRGRLQRDDQPEGSSPSSVQEEEEEDPEEEETASTPPPPPPPCPFPPASDGDQQEEKTARTANSATTAGGGGHPEEYILGRREIDALVGHRGIRSSLKSGKLQRLIQQIDRSASKLSALETAMKHNPDFKEFCDAVLDTIWSARQ